MNKAIFGRKSGINGTVPVIGLYEVKVGKLSEALNKNFLDVNGHKCYWIEGFNG